MIIVALPLKKLMVLFKGVKFNLRNKIAKNSMYIYTHTFYQKHTYINIYISN